MGEGMGRVCVCDGGWKGGGGEVRVSRFLPAQERRMKVGFGGGGWLGMISATDWKGVGLPPLALREPQHERPHRLGEGRHETCPYEGGRGDWTPPPPPWNDGGGGVRVRRGVIGFRPNVSVSRFLPAQERRQGRVSGVGVGGERGALDSSRGIGMGGRSGVGF